MAISKQYAEQEMPYVLAVSPTADRTWRLVGNTPQDKRQTPESQKTKYPWNRRIFDAKNKQSSEKKDYKLVRTEGQPPVSDAAVNAAYDNVGLILDYLMERFEWHSLDNKGGAVEVNVNLGGDQRNNIFWDGEQLNCGKGDGKEFLNFAFSLNTLADALLKAFLQSIVLLEYKGESGALVTHYADVLASDIKQFYNKQTAQDADWLIGEDVLGAKHKGKGIRSLKNPSDESSTYNPQPMHYSNLYKGTQDNGGVHTNSGIPNHAFYLVSMQIGTSAATKLWFETLKILTTKAKFIDFYNALQTTTANLIQHRTIPENTSVVVLEAFSKVGIVKTVSPKVSVNAAIKDRINAVINVFETGSIEREYHNISIQADGKKSTRQITYGSAQTTEQGNLKQLIEQYIKANGLFSKDFETYLPIIGKKPLVDDTKFIELLKKAALEDELMRHIQDEFWDSRYYQAAEKWCNDNGFNYPLSMLVVLDSYVQSGGILQFMRKKFPDLPPKQGGDEKTWIKAYLAVRKEWLLSKGGVLANTVYRVDTFLHAIEKNNWALAQPITANGVVVS